MMDRKAQQGHIYLHEGERVLALQNGHGLVLVAKLDFDRPWPLQSVCAVDANALQPQPMRYFHGQTPR